MLLYTILSLVSVLMMFLLIGIVTNAKRPFWIKFLYYMFGFAFGEAWVLSGMLAIYEVGIESIVIAIMILMFTSMIPGLAGMEIQKRWFN